MPINNAPSHHTLTLPYLQQKALIHPLRGLRVVSNSIFVTRVQFDIISVCRLPGKLAIHTKLCLRQPATNPDDAPNKTEDNDDSDKDAENVSCDNTPSANILIVKEVVHVEPLRRVGKIGEGEIHRKDEDQPHNMHPLGRVRPGNDDFEKRKEAVQAMLTDVAPGVELDREPRSFEENYPVYNRDEEGIRDDGRVEERVERLQRSWKSIE
ncbi:hypothetical protein HG530_009538 [Fusarium avenaceum]|nr:hypothetical protein HG530_009538 [Fusarium avenaceum]